MGALKKRWTAIMARSHMWTRVMNTHFTTLPSKCHSGFCSFITYPAQLVFVHQSHTPPHTHKSVSPPVVASANGIDLRNERFPTTKCKNEFRQGRFYLWGGSKAFIHSQSDISVYLQRHKWIQKWNLTLQVRVLVRASPEWLIFALLPLC